MESIIYRTNCKYCGVIAGESYSSNEIYDMYKKIREANSLEVFAEDDQNYLRNFITLFNGTKVIRG